jgi:hypothetical protein
LSAKVCTPARARFEIRTPRRPSATVVRDHRTQRRPRPDANRTPPTSAPAPVGVLAAGGAGRFAGGRRTRCGIHSRRSSATIELPSTASGDESRTPPASAPRPRAFYVGQQVERIATHLIRSAARIADRSSTPAAPGYTRPSPPLSPGLPLRWRAPARRPLLRRRVGSL